MLAVQNTLLPDLVPCLLLRPLPASLRFLSSLIPAASGPLLLLASASFNHSTLAPCTKPSLFSLLSHIMWAAALVSGAFCPPVNVHLKDKDCPVCPSAAGGGSGRDQVVRQAAGQPGLRVASGRTCSAGTCCTTRAGWTWMTWRWWMWKTGRTVTSM